MKRAMTIFGLLAVLAIIHASLHKVGAYGTENDSVQPTSEVVVTDVDTQSVEPVSVLEGMVSGLERFWLYSGFANAKAGNIIMIIVGLIFIYLAIKYDYEPLLLIPIGTGVLIGNVPFLELAEGIQMGMFSPDATEGLKVGIYEEGSVLNYLYFGVKYGIYPPLIFLGIGAMTDFSALISNPRLMLLGAAAQVGIFITFLGALVLGFTPAEAGAIGIIGGADGLPRFLFRLNWQHI